MTRIKYTYLGSFILLLLLVSCSTERNTMLSRNYHFLTSYYNVYYNGREAFRNGVTRLESSYEDDYSRILDIFRYGNEANSKMVYPDMDKAIRKASKMIKMHSITVKPKRKKGRMSKKEREFHAKKEFNDMIDDGYLLMGKAHFYKHDFQQAHENLDYLIREYPQTDLTFEGYLYKAKAYIVADDFTSARENLDLLENDRKFPKKLKSDLFATYADYYIQQDKYEEAIPWMKKAIEHSRKKKERVRLQFILAQIFQMQEDYPNASELYTKVIKANPSYDMVFSAKIRRASSFSTRYGGAKDLITDLGKMLEDEKNYEYRDQIYFALAEIEIKQGNLDKAIEYYKLSAENSLVNNNQKAASFHALAKIYYNQPNYIESQVYYDSTLYFIDTNLPEFDEVDQRARSLTKLVENLNIIHYEDSMQRLAAMPEKELDALIKKLIADVVAEEKRKEEEERMAMANAAQAKFNQRDPRNRNLAAGGGWYFYNPTAISFGQNEFVRLYGRRKLEDHWRRKSKEVVLFGSEEEEALAENGDSTKIKRPTDNKTKEYYLVDIPFTDSLIALSDDRIMNAYFRAGAVYYEDLENLDEAVQNYEALLQRFPQSEVTLYTYYNLYKLFREKEDEVNANRYKTKIINEYPESNYTQMFTNPNYLQDLASKAEKARALYESTFRSYQNKDFKTVIKNAESAIAIYRDSEYLAQFKYMKALSHGELGKVDDLIAGLEDILVNHPKSEVKKPAQEIMNRLAQEESLKERVASFAEEQKKEEVKEEPEIYQVNNKATHTYVVAVPNKSTDVNRVKYELSNFNLEFFSLNQLKVSSVILNDDYQIVTVKSFDNAKAGMDYFKTIEVNQSFFEELSKMNYQHFVIHTDNFTTFFTDKDIDRYLRFFQKTYPKD